MDKTRSGGGPRSSNQAMYRPISDCIVYFEGRHFYEPHDDEDRGVEEDRGAASGSSLHQEVIGRRTRR